MLSSAIPILHVSNSEAAEAFYRDKLGFAVEFAMRIDPQRADPCYMGFSRDGALLHVSSFSGDSVAGGAVMLLTDDVDALYAEFRAKGIAIDLTPTDQTWGNREMYVRDPDGNALRFTQRKVTSD